MENLSFFDEQQTMENLNGVKDSKHLDVVKLNYESCESLTWQELFFGYDNLCAITYSSGIGFVCELLDRFEQAEIIFGCEDVMDYSMQSVMAYQCKLIERMRNKAYKKLAERVENGTLHLFVARDILSHEKIYLLSAKDGRKRVIMGSANMSAAAFEGRQRENICYMDGDEAFDWYMECYQTLKEKSTDEIGKDSLLCADDGENLEELPIAKTVRVKKAVVIQPVSENQKEEVRFALDVKGLAAKFKPCVPKPDKKGKILLSPDKIKIIRKHVVEAKTLEKEQRSEYPQLDVEPDEKYVTLNEQKLDLNPPKAEVEKDVELFLRYMDGYEKFHGDHIGMQFRYYEFANWFFCSPFMACMRDMAVRYNQNTLPYPVFGLVYGQSKAGKTSFLETLLKMMIGQKTKISAPDFTRSSIDSLKQTVHGAPIIVDDLTNTRFNQHAIETIKIACRICLYRPATFFCPAIIRPGRAAPGDALLGVSASRHILNFSCRLHLAGNDVTALLDVIVQLTPLPVVRGQLLHLFPPVKAVQRHQPVEHPLSQDGISHELIPAQVILKRFLCEVGARHTGRVLGTLEVPNRCIHITHCSNLRFRS